MFTGIIQSLGIIQKCRDSGGQRHLEIRFQTKIDRELRTGESIAVNGVCLTASRVQGLVFHADLVRETLKATTLGKLKPGSPVNLERSLRYGDSLGGHFVSGHVDGCGKIKSIQKTKKNFLFTLDAPSCVSRFLAVKGSVAVDGISLTVQAVSNNEFSVAIVPHTLRVTNLGRKKAGDEVNLEIDLITRYLKDIFEDSTLTRQLVANSKFRKKLSPPSKLSIKGLKKQGF